MACEKNGGAGCSGHMIDEMGFRELYHRFLFITCPEELDSIQGEVEVMPDANGILVYGFVEEDRGMSFLLLCTGKIQDGHLEKGPDVTAVQARVRFDDVRYYSATCEDCIETDISEFEWVREWTKENLETKDRIRQLTYDLEWLDRARNVEVPEYVSVIFQQEGLFPELVWTKVTGFGVTEVFGEVSKAPGQPAFGVVDGQRIGFRILDYGEEGFYLMWDPEIEA